MNYIMNHHNSRLRLGITALALTSILLPLVTRPARAADVVQTAAAAGQFKTLLKAATAAGLAPTLKNTRNITVFAPSDAAFAKLPPIVLRGLLLPRNRALLVSVLKLHVVPRRLPASAVLRVPNGGLVKTLGGLNLGVYRQGSGVRLDPGPGARARVLKTDIGADNGVIHVIDTVLLPPAVARYAARYTR